MHQPGKLKRLQRKTDRLVAGMISGTSADGVDCAITRVTGTGSQIGIEVLSFVSIPYPDELRAAVLRNSDESTSSVKELSQINFRIAVEFAATVRKGCAKAGVDVSDLDLVGSHGQTVHHVPESEVVAGVPIRSTLQIGDPSVLANLLGVTVIGDFRVADMALGGQGAPLVPYGDYALFSDKQINRVLLNLGGIANITVLAAGGSPGDVTAFDTGPANMVIDALMDRLFGKPFDDGGQRAHGGTVCVPLLDELLDDSYYRRRPPKSTGRERFGAPYVDTLVERGRSHGCTNDDLIATASELTVRTVADAIAEHTGYGEGGFQLIVGGGGAHNAYLMRRLAESFPGAEVSTTGDHGIDPDAREAVCFAVMAHETLNEQPTALAAVTGAAQSAILGKICLPTMARTD
ncbi:MAG: anhydro-N-acetylmuramic acid kinase [Rhodothermia bacterium]|nr:anhydro-N-acetylmuramic acid kinase [Rhodothermia bacterium]